MNLYIPKQKSVINKMIETYEEKKYNLDLEYSKNFDSKIDEEIQIVEEVLDLLYEAQMKAEKVTNSY
jgi:hypothetical protein